MDPSEAKHSDERSDLSALARRVEQAGQRAAKAARRRASGNRSAIYYADSADPSRVVQEFPGTEGTRLEREGRQKSRRVAASGEEAAARGK